MQSGKCAQRGSCDVVVSSSIDHNQVPRGIYHYTDTEREIDSSFRIPNFEALDPIQMASELLSSAIRSDTQRRTLTGIELPFTLTGRPLSLQINGESHDAVELMKPRKQEESSNLRRSEMSRESRRAFLHARQTCIEQTADSCDEALDTFHRLRFGTSLMEDQESGENDEQFMQIIEQRLRDLEKNTPNNDAAHRRRLSATHQSSHQSPNDYHDKAKDFLRHIN